VHQITDFQITGWAKKHATLLLYISLPIIDRLSKFFHWHTLLTICDDVIITQHLHSDVISCAGNARHHI